MADSWTFYDSDDVVANDSGKEVASLLYSEFGTTETKKHGHLIAAAPDLLAACEAAMVWLKLKQPFNIIIEPPIVGQVRKAIAKAKGEQP